MRTAFRVDASSQIGLGHAIRCLALAQALAADKADVLFIARHMPEPIAARIERLGFQLFRLATADTTPQNEKLSEDYADWLGVSWIADADQTLQVLAEHGRVDWLIVDHYALDERWERVVGAAGNGIAVIDDLNDRAHYCQLFLNQNFTLEATTRFSRTVPEHCSVLLGPHYALLRPEFSVQRQTALARSKGEVSRILIAYGGADPSGETEKALAALAMVPGIADIQIDVICAASYPRLSVVQAAARHLPNARVLTDVKDMAKQYAQCDLALGAGGGGAWERACLAVPTVLTCIADNQRAACLALAAEGHVVYLGEAENVDANRIAQAVCGLMAAPTWLAWLAQRSATLCDGEGARRVARQLIDQTVRPASNTGLRITIVCSDINHPIWSWLEKWVARRRGEHKIHLLQKIADVVEGDILFLISCAERVLPATRARFGATLVAHASDLPQGRGWSPLVWQIVEGKNDICVSLIEADDPIDSGRIWAQQWLHFVGHELVDEIHAALFNAELQLMEKAIVLFGHVTPQVQPANETTHYRRRTPEDSRIDPSRSLAEQFDLLRIADPVRYPAFFDLRGHRYAITLTQKGEVT